MCTRMGETTESKEQLMTDSSGNQRPRRTRGNITEDGGPEKRDGNYGQGWAGEHGLDRGAG